MHEHLSRGTCIGLSGGSDSVLLLAFLKKYFADNSLSGLLAVHVNHMIRGDEADRDEDFSRELCKALGVEFISKRIDVPALAEASSIGIEEAARNARYSAFADIISGRINIGSISVAHNATDNAETVLFNILRGSGTRGASGIAPVRANIVRPLIELSKSDILATLAESGVPYVTDSTNLSDDYTRNYIRLNVIPKLRGVSANVEEMFTRLSENLRTDADFIDTCASDFLSLHGESITAEALQGLHPSVFSRVINLMARHAGGAQCEHVHVDKIRELLSSRSFKVSIPSGMTFVCTRGVCRVLKDESDREVTFSGDLKLGVNEFSGISTVIILSEEPLPSDFYETSSKVYKISIQRSFDSAIINGVLSVRQKRDGDAYRYGGMTHKLKKVFNDKSIPLEMRSLIPVICDESGILWVPFLPPRAAEGGTSGKLLHIAFAEAECDGNFPKMYI